MLTCNANVTTSSFELETEYCLTMWVSHGMRKITLFYNIAFYSQLHTIIIDNIHHKSHNNFHHSKYHKPTTFFKLLTICNEKGTNKWKVSKYQLMKWWIISYPFLTVMVSIDGWGWLLVHIWNIYPFPRYSESLKSFRCICQCNKINTR